MPSDGPVLTRSASNREGEDLPPGDVAKLSSITNLKTAKLTLYQFDQSPPCWKVRALLHYYEIPYLSVTAYPGGKVEGLDNSVQEAAEVQKELLGLKKTWGSPNGAMRRGWNGITISRDTSALRSRV